MLNLLKRLFRKDLSQGGLIPTNKQQSQPIEMWEIYKKKGNEFLARNDLAQAAECYQKAISINPEYADAHLNMGFVRKEQKLIQEAEKNIEKAILLNPEMVDAYYVLGEIKQEHKDWAGAISNFAKVLELNPNFELAYKELCQAYLKKGEYEKAEVIIRQGLNINSERPDFHVFLGNLHLYKKKFNKALECYEKALSLSPKDANILYNMGEAYVKQKNFLKARLFLERALHINPRFSEAFVALAEVSVKEKKIDEAVFNYQEGIRLNPSSSELHHELGNLWLKQGKRQEAIECYEQVARLRPNDKVIKHLLAALTGEEVDVGSSEYAQKLFDDYAKNFDIHLTQTLKYSPQKLIQLLVEFPAFADKKHDVLDLGCGTGLMGFSIKQYARNLVGVDISSKMLDEAKKRNIYQRLEKSELLALMQSEPSNSFDVILAGDVFVYVGRLEGIFAEVSRLLRPGGLFAFTVEALDVLDDVNSSDLEKGYRLNVTARYAHGKRYIEELLSASGISVNTAILDQIRMEAGGAMKGWFMVCSLDTSDSR